nr:immunoglobulin heavy chain junction region [Mus musculus]
CARQDGYDFYFDYW